MPNSAPWARALLFCNIPVCLSCFCCLKGKHQRECPPARPHPLPAHGGPCLTLFISPRGHCHLPYLAGFRAQRFWQSQSIPCRTALERRGSCCGSVQGRSPWPAPPGSRNLLSGRPGWLSKAQKRDGAAICNPFHKRRFTASCCGCGSESQGSVCLQVLWEGRATLVTVSPLSVLCLLCAWAPATEPSLCCRSASVLESPQWEDPNLNRKPKLGLICNDSRYPAQQISLLLVHPTLVL